MTCERDGIWASIGPMAGPLDGLAVEEVATYARLAQLAGVMLDVCGFRERSWTRFRIASAVIQELSSGETWSINQRRIACGCHSVDFRRRLVGVYEAVLVAAQHRASNSLPDDDAHTYIEPRKDADRPWMADLFRAGQAGECPAHSNNPGSAGSVLPRRGRMQ